MYYYYALIQFYSPWGTLHNFTECTRNEIGNFAKLTFSAKVNIEYQLKHNFHYHLLLPFSAPIRNYYRF
jgi:hypothetical protein